MRLRGQSLPTENSSLSSKGETYASIIDKSLFVWRPGCDSQHNGWAQECSSTSILVFYLCGLQKVKVTLGKVVVVVTTNTRYRAKE